MCIRLFLKPFLYFNILLITRQLLSVKWRYLFPWQIKTRPIYGMETNIKSGNGWFKNFMVLVIYQITQCGKPFFSNTRQNGELTETNTHQNEIELAMFGEWHFFLNSPTNTKYRILRTIGQYCFPSTRWLRPIKNLDPWKKSR